MLIDEDALLVALLDGQISAAGVDVLRKEPPDPKNPLLELPQVLITPHVAAFTESHADRNGEIQPRRRLWELLKSQGMQENQQVLFMSDGGEDVRRVQQYLHPFSEHLLDWFHITMRFTVLQQQTKALQQERPETGADVSKQVESVKHLPWHGNTAEALERLAILSMEPELDPGAFSRCCEGGQRTCRVRDLPTQQLRIHSELRRAMAAG